VYSDCFLSKKYTSRKLMTEIQFTFCDNFLSVSDWFPDIELMDLLDNEDCYINSLSIFYLLCLKYYNEYFYDFFLLSLNQYLSKL